MMRRTALILLLGAFTGALLIARPALAAVREVTVGNFYYDDATPGDGTVEAAQGDQLRFTVLDGGPGTPHTVDIDEFGIHSGSLASGETYTTPPLDRPGTYTLYCKPHQNRGHKATLIVRASTAPPATSAPTTTTAPSGGGTNTTSRPPTSSPSAGGSSGTTSAPPTAAPTEAAPGEAAAGTTDAAPATDTTLAPVGRGEADETVLATAPVDPDSLQAAIGRPPTRNGSWTRSVRLGLLVLLAMTAAAGAALLRGRRLPQQP